MEGLYYLGETRSVDEFKIFSQMPAERLCLGCGVQSDERFGLMPPQDRGKLFAATLRLMHLVLADELMDVLVLWLGDHRQTPGGLRKSTAARCFRRKLLNRPLALRGNSDKVQPNTLYQVVVRYLTGTPHSPAYPVAQLMTPDLHLPQNAQGQMENLAKELFGT